MAIKIGDTIPDINFQFREGDTRPDQGTCPIGGKFVTRSSRELFANKRVIIFSLPGAFTPTCSTYQLPGFDQNFETFKNEGIDDIFVVSVNDAFVMNAWATDCAIKNIKTIPDGNGDFSKSLNLLNDQTKNFMGIRCTRFALISIDNNIEKLFIEKPREFKVSSAENILAQL